MKNIWSGFQCLSFIMNNLKTL